MPSPLLQATLNVGEHLRRAVQADDFEHAETLAAARGVLVERLLAETTPAMYTEQEVDALSAQHQALAEALASREDSLRDALATLARQRRAHTCYDGATPRTSILRTVHG